MEIDPIYAVLYESPGAECFGKKQFFGLISGQRHAEAKCIRVTRFEISIRRKVPGPEFLIKINNGFVYGD